MDILDLIIVAVIALGGWNGYRTGLIRQVTRLFGAIIAYVVSFWARPYVAPVIRGLHILPQKTGMFGTLLGDLSGAAAFAVVFMVTFAVLHYIASLLDALFRLPVLSTLNRLAGLAAGLALAVVFVYVGTLVAHYVNNNRLQWELTNSTIIQWLDTQKLPYALPSPAHLPPVPKTTINIT